jgi:Asp-tRNA(Asn)/Glu-tRNA(Gln) amidotransferase A subunit family amidase
VVGLKPTYGSIATRGVAPLAPSQDTVGLIAETVDACVRAYACLAEATATSAPAHAGLRVGRDATTYAGVAPDVAVAIRDLLDELHAGVRLVPLDPLPFELAAAASALVIFHEAPRVWAQELIGRRKDSPCTRAQPCASVRDRRRGAGIEPRSACGQQFGDACTRNSMPASWTPSSRRPSGSRRRSWRPAESRWPGGHNLAKHRSRGSRLWPR